MSSNPTYISVLVTSYNREKYIAECLSSILSSSYPNFELLVLDDASTDNTVAIAREFERRDRRVKVLVNEKNLGQFPNRNKAAGLAQFKYLKFFDSDDVMYPHCLEVFANAIQTYPNAGYYAEWHSNIFTVSNPLFIRPIQAFQNHYFKGSTFLSVGPSGALYNKDVYLLIGGFNETVGILADTLLNLNLASLAHSVAIPRNTFYWRIHKEQVTEEQKDHVRMLQERYEIDMIILRSPHLPLHHDEKEKCISSVKKIFGVNLIKMLLKGNLRGVLFLMRTCGFSLNDLLLSVMKIRILKFLKVA